MNTTTRNALTRYSSNPKPSHNDKFALSRFEKLLVDNVDALFDSAEYNTYLPFQSLYVDGATMKNRILICNTCETPLREARENYTQQAPRKKFPFTSAKLVAPLFLRNTRQH